MPSSKIENFAQVLVKEVRDRAIAGCDNMLSPDANGVVAKRWRKELEHSDGLALAHAIIPDCVDSVIFHLLNAVDAGVLRLSYTDSDGDVVDLGAEGQGELSGWYMASGEWRERYSKQRFVDDFTDL